MSEMIPFGDAGAQLPAYLRGGAAPLDINKDVAVGQQFPSISIKGKVFHLVKDNERKMMMDPREPDEPARSLQLVALRANVKARTYYQAAFKDGDSDGARPTCFSMNGIEPSNGSVQKQSAKCGVCPHAIWGSKVREDGTPGEGTECAVNTRLAVAAADALDKPFLLRVPAGSRKNFSDAVKTAETRKIPYNAIIFKVGFDPEAPSPKLTFKPVGLLDGDGYTKAKEMYETELVLAIIGKQDEVQGSAPAPVSSEVDSLPRLATATVAAATAPAPAVQVPTVQAAPPAPVAVAPAPAVVAAASVPSAGNLMADLDELLKQTDD